MGMRVPGPLASPFAKAVLCLFWLVYAAIVVALAVGAEPEPGLLFIIAGWTFILPWLTWAFLVGGVVRIQSGKSVGGGLLYPRVALEPDEDVIFQAPCLMGLSQGHVFVTSHRVLVVPIRFSLGGAPRTMLLGDILVAEVFMSGFNWPLPKSRVKLTFPSSSLTVRPAGNGIGGRSLAKLMGLTTPAEFVQGLSMALERGGVPFRTGSDEPP
jgi:hypothetical protein